jgi:hypothetical protein
MEAELDALLSEVLAAQGRVVIEGLGTLSVRTFKGYAGRNPKTGVSVQVPDRRGLFLSLDDEVQEGLDEGGLEHLASIERIRVPVLEQMLAERAADRDGAVAAVASYFGSALAGVVQTRVGPLGQFAVIEAKEDDDGRWSVTISALADLAPPSPQSIR